MVIPFDGETVTRWVLVWPNGEHLQVGESDSQSGPVLYRTKAQAAVDAQTFYDRPTPTKVRVTIEVVK